VGLERCPLSLVSTIEELLGRNNSCFGLEIREYSRGDPLRWPRDTLYPQKLTLTSPTSGRRLVGIFYSLNKATEFVCSFLVSCALNINFSVMPGSLMDIYIYKIIKSTRIHGGTFLRRVTFLSRDFEIFTAPLQRRSVYLTSISKSHARTVLVEMERSWMVSKHR
jgi:hypothetical protein